MKNTLCGGDSKETDIMLYHMIKTFRRKEIISKSPRKSQKHKLLEASCFSAPLE